ncbi:MAG: hypothetical protein V7607_1726 [Solirubrobacteraceae bacterium]
MHSSVPGPWLGVEPRHLATFVAVADAGSFRAAADRIGYVQSAVSQHIALLESALGVRLIERGQGARGVALTAGGNKLLGPARRIVGIVHAASADIRQLSGAEPIRIAVEPAAYSMLAKLIRRFRAALPGVELAVSEVPAAAQPELVRSSVVELGLGAFGESPAGLSSCEVDVDRWVLLTPLGSPLADCKALLSLAALRGARLIEDRSHPLPIAMAEFGPARVVRCDRVAIALELIRAGAGSAILPAQALPAVLADIAVVELGDLLAPRVVSVIWHRCRRLPSIADVLATAAADEAGGRRFARIPVAQAA